VFLALCLVACRSLLRWHYDHPRTVGIAILENVPTRNLVYEGLILLYLHFKAALAHHEESFT